MRVLLLDLDALRPDHIGAYGYHRNTTPNIDEIAKKGVRFTNYYTTDAPCAPSRNAFMTGQFGIRTGNIGHGGTAGDMRHEGPKRGFSDRLQRESFPGIFRKKGMKTVLISPFAERHSSWQFYAGFNEIYNTGKCGGESAEEVTPTVLDWIERNGKDDDWFLYVNFWDAHTPYRAPEEYGNPFENDPLPEWLTEEVLEEQRKQVTPHGPREIYMYDNRTLPEYPRYPGELKDMNDVRKMIDGYDTGIRYMDENIGMVFSALEKQGVMDDLIIIITTDHGENMGELGIYGEHSTADDITCRIPMIVRWPGMMEGHVDEDLHYHIDFAPTVAELLNQDPSPSWDGKSYAPVLMSGEKAGRDYLVISQNAHVCQRSVRFGDWIYIRTYHDGFHLFDKEMLFNLKEDPHEQYNIAKENKDVCMEAVYYLNEWHDEMMMKSDCDTDPLWTVMKEGGPAHARGHLQHYIKHLEKTGRGHAIPELKRRHPQEFK